MNCARSTTELQLRQMLMFTDSHMMKAEENDQLVLTAWAAHDSLTPTDPFTPPLDRSR